MEQEETKVEMGGEPTTFRQKYKSGIITRAVVIILGLIGWAFYSRYYHWVGQEVLCDIGVGNPWRGKVVAEYKDYIYVEGAYQCTILDDCRGAPGCWMDNPEDEDYGYEPSCTKGEWVSGEEVLAKEACYRVWSKKDKMKAIMNREGLY